MRSKKIRSLVLVALLLLALTAPGYAVNGGKTRITGKCTLPDIKIEVSVPSTGRVYINPKRLPVKVSGKVENGQIMTDPSYIENLSEVPVKVSATVTGAVKSGSDMALNAATTQDLTTTAKKAFIYFEIHAADDPDTVSWDSEYDEEKHIVVRTSAKTKKDIVALGAGGQGKCYGAFRLSGDCIESPKTPWTARDGVNVEIVFTFTPMATTDSVS